MIYTLYTPFVFTRISYHFSSVYKKKEENKRTRKILLLYVDKLHLKRLQREASIALGLSIKRLSERGRMDDGDDDAEVDGKISTI